MRTGQGGAVEGVWLDDTRGQGVQWQHADEVAEGGAAEGVDEGARPGRAVGGTPEGGACRRVLAKVHGRSGRTTDTRSPEEVPLATDGGGVRQDVTLEHCC